MFGKNKPVKIRSYSENRKYGIAAKDVKELLKKACSLLQVSLVVISFKHLSTNVPLFFMRGYDENVTAASKQKKLRFEL